MVPTDDTFDFGLSDDPFNLNRDANSTSRIVKSRVTTARASGRLDIAALGLKEIPKEVLDMYNLESIGKYDGSWAESVDLTRFVAADNEMEMIDDSVFPDIDPEELAEDEDAQGNIFAGLETLDLHGNVLIALPAGLRRLTLLTSLNLVCHDLSSCCENHANVDTSLPIALPITALSPYLRSYRCEMSSSGEICSGAHSNPALVDLSTSKFSTCMGTAFRRSHRAFLSCTVSAY